MNKYYIPEIDIRILRNQPNILAKLEKKYNKNTDLEKRLLTSNGLYKLEKNKLIKYKIYTTTNNIQTNYIKKFTLLTSNITYKKLGEHFQIPFQHKFINIQIIKYNIGKSNTFQVT